MKACITHHHACDCREAKFAELVKAADRLSRAFWKLDAGGYVRSLSNPHTHDQCDMLCDAAHDCADRIQKIKKGLKS